MITSNIELNNLHVKEIEIIQVNCVAQLSPQTICLWCQRNKVNSPLDCANREDMNGSDATTRLTKVASFEQGLHQRLTSLLVNHHTSSLTYRPWCKCLNQGRKPINARFSILDDKMTLQSCGKASSSWLQVVIWARPPTEKHCDISPGLMLSPPCGPSVTNHMNYLLSVLKICHRNCHCVLPNEMCIVEITAILLVIDVVCDVCKSLETPSNVMQ